MMERSNTECSIKGTPYEIDEVYFAKIMRDVGRYLCERYRKVDVVTPLEVMSQLAYINDLTINQKMYLGFFLGRFSENMEYEGMILQYMNDEDIVI